MSIWLSTNVYCWLLGFMQMIQLEDEKHTEEKGQWLFNIFFDRHPHLSQMVLEGQRRRARQPLLDWCKSYDTKRWETYQRRLSARNGNVHLYIIYIYMSAWFASSAIPILSQSLKFWREQTGHNNSIVAGTHCRSNVQIWTQFHASKTCKKQLQHQ